VVRGRESLESKMSNVQSSGTAAAEQLSALVDGELAGDEVARACAAWRGDAAAL